MDGEICQFLLLNYTSAACQDSEKDWNKWSFGHVTVFVKFFKGFTPLFALVSTLYCQTIFKLLGFTFALVLVRINQSAFLLTHSPTKWIVTILGVYISSSTFTHKPLFCIMMRIQSHAFFAETCSDVQCAETSVVNLGCCTFSLLQPIPYNKVSIYSDLGFAIVTRGHCFLRCTKNKDRHFRDRPFKCKFN